MNYKKRKSRFNARPVLLACILLLPIGWASASPPSAISAGTSVQSVSTVHGKTAAFQVALQTGIDTSAFQQQAKSSPFSSTSTDVVVTTTRRFTTSVTQAVNDLLPSNSGSAHTLWSDGDTATYSWTSGCTRFTETFTWEGGATGGWVETGLSMTAVPGCKAPTG